MASTSDPRHAAGSRSSSVAVRPGLEALLVLVGQGDLAAFSWLYDSTSSRVVGLIHAILRDARLADELAEQVYCEIWRNAATFDPNQGSATWWIFTLAHSRAIDKLRSMQSNRTSDAAAGRTSPDHSATDPAIGYAGRTGTGHPPPAALAQLTPLEQQAIHLTYFLGLTCNQASDQMGIPIPTVKARIRDGLNTLRRTTHAQ